MALKRLSQAAADFVVEHDWTASINERILFGDNYPQELGENDQSFIDFLTTLHLKFYGTTPSAERLELDKNKWLQLSNQFGDKQAWKALVSVYLRDPSFWTY